MACSNAVGGGSVSVGLRSVSLDNCLKAGKTMEMGTTAAMATPSCALSIRASPNAAMTSTATSPSRERGGCELLLQGNWSGKGEGSWGLMRSSSSRQHRFHDRKQTDQKKGLWRMEMASDPLNNCRDSFGNECAVEKRARKLRDYINTMELRKRVLEISAKPRTAYRVGDVIIHRRYGYRGVIYGHDPECSAPEDWQEAMRIDMLNEGRNQSLRRTLCSNGMHLPSFILGLISSSSAFKTGSICQGQSFAKSILTTGEREEEVEERTRERNRVKKRVRIHKTGTEVVGHHLQETDPP
ncbi:hypothetical protein CBR_g3150 [Chara braunii]|uniref:Hemimethylated DNA-binding domain-containing protein n=1 Tax=Chara braunii TaxID=69332 RepID=A0A388KEY3_CHABU|nr:hypothetical protein CBR_g3150 [Chara braunii]|eukprot:GBG68609.1 hypothetical protein CBR_g3150 [Chara braunii]